jgi:hypothetical protein
MALAGQPGVAAVQESGRVLRAEGADSLVIKELMGHESLATAAIYVNPRELHQTVEPIPFLRQLAV